MAKTAEGRRELSYKANLQLTEGEGLNLYRVSLSDTKNAPFETFNEL